MSQVITYLQELIQECRANDIRATLDPRSVSPPCVVFAPPSLDININRGATAAFTAIVVSPGPGNADAFAALDQLAQDVCRDVLVNAESLVPVNYAPDDGAAYPAYEISWTASLDWPEPCNPTP